MINEFCPVEDYIELINLRLNLIFNTAYRYLCTDF